MGAAGDGEVVLVQRADQVQAAGRVGEAQALAEAFFQRAAQPLAALGIERAGALEVAGEVAFLHEIAKGRLQQLRAPGGEHLLGTHEVFHQFRRQPTTAPGMWSRAEVVGYYGEQTGLTVSPDEWRFYEAFGLFRLAVISQQIYYRYFHGQTHNPAYAVFGQATSYLANRALQVIG